MKRFLTIAFVSILSFGNIFASEADILIPDLHKGTFHIFRDTISAWNFLLWGALIISITLGISLYFFFNIKKIRAHRSMLEVSKIIYKNCSTYLKQQGKFLLILFVFIASIMSYYFLSIENQTIVSLLHVLMFTIIGVLGSG